MRDHEIVLSAFVERAMREPEIEGLVLYGSVARDDSGCGSDIDLMVISRKLNAEMRSRVERIRDELVFEHGIAITLLFETSKSMMHMVRSGDPFIFNVLEEARFLIDRKAHLKRLRSKLPMLYVK